MDMGIPGKPIRWAGMNPTARQAAGRVDLFDLPALRTFTTVNNFGGCRTVRAGNSQLVAGFGGRGSDQFPTCRSGRSRARQGDQSCATRLPRGLGNMWLWKPISATCLLGGHVLPRLRPYPRPLELRSLVVGKPDRGEVAHKMVRDSSSRAPSPAPEGRRPPA